MREYGKHSSAVAIYEPLPSWVKLGVLVQFPSRDPVFNGSSRLGLVVGIRPNDMTGVARVLVWGKVYSIASNHLHEVDNESR